MIELYDQAGTNENNGLTFAKEGPTVILFVGVNGVGKTTTIGKMANLFKQQGKKSAPSRSGYLPCRRN